MVTTTSRRRIGPAFLLAGGLGLAGCGGGGLGNVGYGGLGAPNVGTAAGAASGAAVGRAVAGRNNNLAAILGGAALGGLAGNVFLDRPSGERRQAAAAAEAEVARDRDQQRRLEYERQSELQREDVRRQIEDQRLFEEWKQQRGGTAGAAAPAPAGQQSAMVNGAADVAAAQRLLTALGYYSGPLDGRMGAQTRSAVMQFEANQGLPQTGVVTPSIVSRMRASL